MVIQLAPIIPQELSPDIKKTPSPGALLRNRSWSVIGESQDPTPCHTPRLRTITFTRSLGSDIGRTVKHTEEHPTRVAAKAVFAVVTAVGVLLLVGCSGQPPTSGACAKAWGAGWLRVPEQGSRPCWNR